GSIREVLITLVIAVGLVVLVMCLFLQSWRATLIPTLTMPVSLVGAFAFVHLLGFSINTLTLFAIVLATGIVVDDAIVVIENVERHIQDYHKDPATAASDAMGEVFSAVVATALVLIAVFVPVAFFPGSAAATASTRGCRSRSCPRKIRATSSRSCRRRRVRRSSTPRTWRSRRKGS